MNKINKITIIIIWIILFILAIILYTFRYDLINFRNEILSELFPSKAFINKEERKIILKKENNSHFYIYVTINNHKIKFLIDTGATNNTISLSQAKKIGINIDRLNFNQIAHTANGKIMSAYVKLDNIFINNIEFNNIIFSVANSDLNIALLGIKFLEKFKKYQFYQNKLIIYY